MSLSFWEKKKGAASVLLTMVGKVRALYYPTNVFTNLLTEGQHSLAFGKSVYFKFELLACPGQCHLILVSLSIAKNT